MKERHISVQTLEPSEVQNKSLSYIKNANTFTHGVQKTKATPSRVLFHDCKKVLRIVS